MLKLISLVKQSRFLLILFGLCWAFNFYLHLSKVDRCFFVDLRNRVVGARLMKQEISPYFFKWSSRFPETLKDPNDGCDIKFNMVTAPPSVLFLMEPLTGLSYKKICYYWTIIHYLFFLFIFAPIYFYFQKSPSRDLITISGILLLFSWQWVLSVFVGQSHFILPAILSVIILLSSGKSHYRFLIIGLLFSFLVWIRPNAILICPFLLCCKDINRMQIIAGLLIGGLIFASITLALHHQAYWIDFYLSCKDWIKVKTEGTIITICSPVEMVEGKRVKFEGQYPAHLDNEVVNLFVILKDKFNISVKQSYILVGTVVLYLIGLFLLFIKPFRFLPEALLIGMLMYWLFETTTPINKNSYYFLELFIVIYYLAGKFNKLYNVGKAFFVLSFVLIFIPSIHFNMSYAEYCCVTSLGFYLLKEYLQPQENAGRV